MKRYHLLLASLYLRIALGATMLSAVADRLGFWGAPGEPGVAWGNWDNFVANTADLNSFVPSTLIPFLAVMATGLETVFSLLLIVGLWTRAAALGTGCLLSLFGLSMAISYGFKAPLDYSVYIAGAGGFLLAAVAEYKFSIDDLLKSSGRPGSTKSAATAQA